MTDAPSGWDLAKNNNQSQNDCSMIKSFDAECFTEDKKAMKDDVHLLNFKDLQRAQQANAKSMADAQ